MKKVPRTTALRIVVLAVLGVAIVTTVMICTNPFGTPQGPVTGPGGGTGSVTPQTGDYVILAANDLGMHCMQNDYSKFMVLPPANTLHVQVFRKGGESARNLTSGITVSYSVNKNTTSADKINFWTYASNFGFTLQPNQGITGNYLSGTCALSPDGRFWEAQFVPVTPYMDKGPTDTAFPYNPYPTVTITVKNSTSGAVLQTTDLVVMPVSDEMRCNACHGPGLEPDIITAHDQLQGTNLMAAPVSCSSCHKDNALGAPGAAGVPSLSTSMHSFHATRMSTHPLPDPNPCYACHPGHATQCLRGAMFIRNFTCTSCHGDMATVADPAREAWLVEPSCSMTGCHSSLYAPNPGTLYRNSYLTNGPSDMNNEILCTDCHGSPHAEWVSSLALDNELPQSVIGRVDFIRDCTACHGGSGRIHR